MNALEKITQEVPALTPMTPVAMLGQAIASGMSPEIISKLMDQVERWEKREAQKAFNEAFAAFKSEAIMIVRNRRVTDGPLKGKSYAELFSVVDAATPALSKYGLSASWEITRDEKDWIEVTCVVEHALGGNKRVPIGGPPDTGGAKNAIQARVSTITYLERATLKAALGLAEQGDDTDGRAPSRGATITEEQTGELLAHIESVGANKAQFLKYFKIEALPELPAARYQEAVNMLNAKARAKA